MLLHPVSQVVPAVVYLLVDVSCVFIKDALSIVDYIGELLCLTQGVKGQPEITFLSHLVNSRKVSGIMKKQQPLFTILHPFWEIQKHHFMGNVMLALTLPYLSTYRIPVVDKGSVCAPDKISSFVYKLISYFYFHFLCASCLCHKGKM